MKLIAERTFNLLKGFGFDVASFNKEGDLVIDPMEATRFAVESPNILVRLDPTEKYLSLKTGNPGESIDKLRPMLKELAQDYLLDFDYSVFDKQIRPKGEKIDVAKKSQEEIKMSEDMKELRILSGLKENTKDNCTACDQDMAVCDCKLCKDCDSKGCENCDDGKVLKVDQKESVSNLDEIEVPKFLKRPPGADIKFGQDRDQKLDFSANIQKNALAMKKFERDIQRGMPTLGKLDKALVLMAWEIHQLNGDDPVPAYHQAMAKARLDPMAIDRTTANMDEDFPLRPSYDTNVTDKDYGIYRAEIAKVYGNEDGPDSALQYYYDAWQKVKGQRDAKAKSAEAYRMTVQAFAGKERNPLNASVQMEMAGIAMPYLSDFGNWSWGKSLTNDMDADDGFTAFKDAIISQRGTQGTGGYTAQNLSNPQGSHYQEILATWSKGLELHGWTVINGMLNLQEGESLSEASLGKMTGSRKSSYQPLTDNVKIVVRHSKDVNEEIRGARSRNIHSILIQRGEEKFKMAENNLQAARAMARHLHNGGETFDSIGEAITEMSREFKKLREFIGYVRTAKLVNETNQEFVTMALENIDTIRTSFKRLSGVKTYANAVESVEAYNNVELLQDDIDLETKFTETHFDDKVANVMDTLKASASRKHSFESRITKAIELESFENIRDHLKEDELLEFENLNQQLGHQVSRLGYSAKDETLGNYLHSISSKLNAGGQLSQFEYGAIKSSLLSAGQHNVQPQSAPMTASESYEAFLDRFVD